jgi:hypothetical protein
MSVRQTAALIALLTPFQGLAADLVFSGKLQRVASESVAVKLADRRVIFAHIPNERGLTRESIAERYKIGDWVEIKCRRIQPVYEEDVLMYLPIELTKIRFLRAASGDEAAPSNPLLAETSDANLENARRVNLQYASAMPNFVADETAKRYIRHRNAGEWISEDTIESEVAFQGNRETRQNMRRNGEPWDRPFQALPGYRWYGGFGSELRALFLPRCPNAIEYRDRLALGGKQLLEYTYHSPPDGCFGPFTVEYERYNAERTGRFLVEDPGGNLVQFDEDASGFPNGFSFVQSHKEVRWDYVKIGGAMHMLPVRANFVVQYAFGDWWRVDVEYKKQRHFESSSNIQFR